MWEELAFENIREGDIIRETLSDGEIVAVGRAKTFSPGRAYDTWEFEDGTEIYGFGKSMFERLT